MPQLRFLAHSVQGESLQCFNSPHLAKGFMSSAIEPQQGEGMVWSRFLPVAAQSLGTLAAVGAAAPVLWETQCRRAGSCHHGEEDYFSVSLGWGSTPETARASSAGAATREKSCHGTSYKHSAGYFKHSKNEISNHGFQSGKALEQAKVSIEVRVGAKRERTAWPQRTWVSGQLSSARSNHRILSGY